MIMIAAVLAFPLCCASMQNNISSTLFFVHDSFILFHSLCFIYLHYLTLSYHDIRNFIGLLHKPKAF